MLVFIPTQFDLENCCLTLLYVRQVPRGRCTIATLIAKLAEKNLKEFPGAQKVVKRDASDTSCNVK